MKIRCLRKVCIVFSIIVILLLSNSLVVAQPEKEILKKSLFNLQFYSTLSWSANDTLQPILPGEIRVVHLTITSGVIRGLFGKFLLTILTGQPYIIQITVEDTPEWCTAWLSQEYLTQVINPDEVIVQTIPLYIFLNDDAPINTVGCIKIHLTIYDKKGPFDMITLIGGFEQKVTLAFITGP